MDLELVDSFLMLVREGHFGRAAARLHLTSSALTKRVQRLERDLGVVLVDRGATATVTPTAAGQQFAADAAGLLARADATRAAARAAARSGAFRARPVRLGFPAGTGASTMRHVDLPGIARSVRLNFPEVRVQVVPVPFSGLAGCLPDGLVDVLWVNGAVRHPDVTSYPLAVTSSRVGVVGERHPLAEAGTVDVADFLRYPIGYNPAVADEFMGGLWLADVRPRAEARLVAMGAENQAGNLRHTAGGTAAMVTYPLIAAGLGARLRLVRLTGALPAATFYVARRRADRHGPIGALVEALRRLDPRRLPDLPVKPGS
jgi:DNA-binding transcriptional LysR family regulator